jgi:hypothetical protein
MRTQVNAGHYALLAGMGASKLGGNPNGTVGFKKDKVATLSAAAAVLAAAHAYHGWKQWEDEVDNAANTARRKTDNVLGALNTKKNELLK